MCWFSALRVEEHLHLCGVRKELLSSKARLHLQLIASLASTLQLAHTAPQMILAAWAALNVQYSKAIALKVGSTEQMRPQKVQENQSQCP
jgi:hypothetical protein